VQGAREEVGPSAGDEPRLVLGDAVQKPGHHDVGHPSTLLTYLHLTMLPGTWDTTSLVLEG